MATDSRALPAFFNTDADFQSWCQGIAAQLVVAGMVKTTDSGQINNATVSKPAAINTSQGYEIYRFNDSLQSGTPIYFKIEYGSGGAVDRPSFWVTVGSGSNGSGTLTGTLTTRTQTAAAVSKSAGATLTSYIQGDSGGFVLVANYDPTLTTPAVGVLIDRPCDAAGNATTDGVAVALSGGTGTSFAQCILGGAATTSVTSQAYLNAAGITGVSGAGARIVGGNTGVLPAMIFSGQLRFSKRFVTYNSTDLPGEPTTTMSATNLGTAHTYLLMAHYQPNWANASPTAILWE